MDRWASSIKFVSFWSICSLNVETKNNFSAVQGDFFASQHLQDDHLNNENFLYENLSSISQHVSDNLTGGSATTKWSTIKLVPNIATTIISIRVGGQEEVILNSPLQAYGCLLGV